MAYGGWILESPISEERIVLRETTPDTAGELSYPATGKEVT